MVQLSCNMMVSGIPSHFRLENTDIILNYLIRGDDLYLTEDFMSFGGDGTFYLNKGNVHHNDKLINLGVYAPGQGDF